MPRELWNEGRVVGYSAYEMYVRHHCSVDPDHSPASEKEWLASMMAMGSSMLLRIGTESNDNIEGEHIVDIPLPANSRLCAANNIIASYFSGKGYVNGSENSTGWATKVTDYGTLIDNEQSKHPDGEVYENISAANIPPKSEKGGLDESAVEGIREYMKITDGIVIQPGTWTTNLNKPPYEDFKPELSKAPTIRLSFSDRINKPFYVLFTGFTNRTVVDGQTGFETAVNTKSPADGDFLGPWAFPWAAKIFFHVPTSFISYYMDNNYSRKLPKDGEDTKVDSDAVVDMSTTNPADYYKSTNNYQSSAIDVDVTNIHTLKKNAAVLATYRSHKSDESTSKTEKLPPALYGAVVSQKGETKYNPIDTVAPGTVKLYHITGDLTDTKAQEMVEYLEKNTPYNYGFYRDGTSYVVYEYDSSETARIAGNNYIPVSDDKTINVNGLQTYNTKYVWPFVHSSSFWYKFAEQGNPTNKTGTSCEGCSKYSDGKCSKEGKRNDNGECIVKNGPGGSPAWFELKNVAGFIVGEVETGQFSDGFIAKYGIPLSEARDMCSNLDGDSYWHFLDNECHCDCYGNYWDAISEEDASKYSIIITSKYCYFKYDGEGSYIQISYMVIRNSDGAIADMAWRNCSLHGVSGGFDFTHETKSTVKDNGADKGTDNPGTENNPYSEEYVTQQIKSAKSGNRYYDKSVTRYLGSWWDKKCSKSAECELKDRDPGHCKFVGKCACVKDFGGNVIFNGHKAIKEVAPYTGFYLPDAGAPDASGISFADDPGKVADKDYIDWEYNTPIADLFEATGQGKKNADGSLTITDDSLKAIHESYRGLSIGEFFQRAAMRDLGKPDEASNNYSSSSSMGIYIFTNETIKKYCEWYRDNKNNQRSDYPELKASAKITIPGTSTDFYASRMWKLEEGKTDENGVFESEKDITELANRTSSAIYAAEGTSGHHKAKGISVVDIDGQILQFAGTGAIIETDYITWLDLLDALDHNKKVDILGEVLRGLKVHLTGSGVNYLEFKGNGDKDSLRVYFDKKAPESSETDQIPDGSIGIGW